MNNRTLLAVLGLFVIAGLILIVSLIRATQASPTPAPSLLERSLRAMSRVPGVHSVGTYREHEVEDADTRSKGKWHVQGDCATQGFKTVSRFVVKDSQSGLRAGSVDNQYLVASPRNPNNFYPSDQRVEGVVPQSEVHA